MAALHGNGRSSSNFVVTLTGCSWPNGRDRRLAGLTGAERPESATQRQAPDGCIVQKTLNDSDLGLLGDFERVIKFDLIKVTLRSH